MVAASSDTPIRLAVRIMALLSLLIASCSDGAAATSVQPPVPAAAGKSWHLVFSEEFDGNDYDHTKLTPCFDWNYGHCTSSFNEGRETYRPEQIRVRDGVADLVAEPLPQPLPDTACDEDLCTYKSGLLSTARPKLPGGKYLFPFTYGYVEARLRVPADPGFFTAFWMVPTNPEYKYRSEIDIAEIEGSDPDSIHMTYAYDDREQSFKVNEGPDANGACPARDYSQDWVRFGVDWQPDHIAWYVNGVECGKFTDAAKIENGPMQLILMLSVNNGWSRSVGSVAGDPAVSDLEVDYIRIYQQK